MHLQEDLFTANRWYLSLSPDRPYRDLRGPIRNCG